MSPFQLSALFAAVLGSLATLVPPPAEASCGTSSCPLDLGDLGLGNATKTAQPGIDVQIVFERIDQNQSRFGTKKVGFGEISRPDHDEIETLNRNTRLLLQYRFGDVWSFQAELPVVNRRHIHLSAGGHQHNSEDQSRELRTGFGPAAKAGHRGVVYQEDPLDRTRETWDFTRVGDLAVEGSWQSPLPRFQGPRLGLTLGFRLPTGSTAVENADRQRAEPTLQPGRGAYGLLAGAAISHRLPSPLGRAQQDVRLRASVSLQLNADGRKGFHFGAERSAHLGVHIPVSGKVTLLGQLVGHWSNQHRPGRTGELTDATGGTEFLLNPGMEVKPLHNLTAYWYYQHPVHQDVNQVQVTADANLLVGLGYYLPLYH